MLKFLCCGCCCSKSQEIESKVESSARLIIDEANQNSNSNFDPEEIEEEGWFKFIYFVVFIFVL